MLHPNHLGDVSFWGRIYYYPYNHKKGPRDWLDPIPGKRKVFYANDYTLI